MNAKLLALMFALLSMTQTLHIAHEGQYAWYTFDEGPTGNRCASSNKCDGQRTCSPFGWCQGVSRPPKNSSYRYNEGVTGNKCPSSSSAANFKIETIIAMEPELARLSGGAKANQDDLYDCLNYLISFS